MTGKRPYPPRQVLLIVVALLVATVFAPLGPTAVRAATDLPIGGAAVIANANGDPVRLRDLPGPSGAIIGRFPEGTTVEVIDGPVAAPEDGSLWYAVAVDDLAGYMAATYLALPTGGDASSEVTGIAVIVNTNGDGIRCRAKANTSASIIVVLSERTQVPLRGAVSGSWQPVTCAGQKGFVYSLYIGPIDDSGDDDGAGGGSDTGLESGDTAVVAGTNGDGVRLRSRAGFSASVITVVGEGQEVQVRSGSTGEWVAVTYRGSDGFIHMDYLVRGRDGGDGGGSGGGFGIGDHAMVTENLRLRDDPNFDGEVLAIAVPSTVVVVTGSAVDGFYPVDWDGLEGWMHGDYLDWTDAPTTPRDTGAGGDVGSDSGSADGQAMVDYAMQYLGYPYVYATHGPDTFDCSGFTYWVALNVLGENIGTGTWTQSVEGRPVAYGQLQPGDLVFFQNTYTWGLSHVGIYIGDNQFISAENEDTGVRISRLDSPYYSTRWYGARRIV